jgi:AcrR family transcriptional regulator
MTESAARTATDPDLSPRRAHVLATVLDVLLSQGDRFSMAQVAQAAACSKETLYKWFGDRDGLLTATVQWQAARVTMPEMLPQGLTRESFRAGLIAFAESWIKVIAGDASIALNRAAVAQPSGLGQIVLANGPRAMAGRLEPIFSMGRDAGVIAFESFDDAFSAFFGLVIGDLQICALLGDARRLDPPAIHQRAAHAVDRFMTLFGVQPN